MSEPIDTRKIFKRLVHCFGCDEAFYFTLWAIAENRNLACPHCGTHIDLADDAYQPLVASVKDTITAIGRY
jgi:DNA-directed RNA polymerase subunit RPC12/RpoP